jgi:translin
MSKYLDIEYIQRLKQRFDEADATREGVLNLGRVITKDSKSAIYSLIRDDWQEAESRLAKMGEDVLRMKALLQKNCRLSYLADVSFREYTEALILYHFLKSRRIPTHEELGVDEEAFVTGLMDATGELLRKSVEEMIRGDLAFANEAKEFIEDVYKSMLEMNFKDYEIRKKVDYVSNNLSKLVDYIFAKSSRP